ncbi:hypothetical protein EXIGLDRAFT_761215 [Exidia glandulosa HHB12029]|uniref:DUF6533 domain-containing protein n=1 Tax=Exidia glandulosa HHB12029 TaxID=1314781 RepID=A0A165NLS5_EXIGL|nr:hypothetical protein EXIGLDRAFT_761215 [Exidia glandulosa HHB12029]
MPLALPTADNPLAPFLPMLWHFRASMYLTVAGTVIFMYDWIITFGDEFEHIWKGRFNTVKALYLFNRVVTPLVLAFDLYDKGGLARNLTPTVCVSLFLVRCLTLCSFVKCHYKSTGGEPYSPSPQFTASPLQALRHFRAKAHAGIVALRVWTLYGRSRLVLFVFILLFSAYFGATAVVWGLAAAEISETIYPSPLLVNLCYTVIPPWMWYLWLPSIVFECVIFLLTVYKAWQHWQTDINTPILTVLYRDGFVYFFVISCLSLVNLFIWLWAPPSLALLFKYFSLPAVNVVAFRLVLDLRDAGLQARQTGMGPTIRSTNKSDPVHISFDHFELAPRGQSLNRARSNKNRTPAVSVDFLSFHGSDDAVDAVEEGRSVSLEHEMVKSGKYQYVADDENIYDTIKSYKQSREEEPRSAGGYVELSRNAMLPVQSPISPDHGERSPLMQSTSSPVGMRPPGTLSPTSPSSLRIPAELLDAIAAVSVQPPSAGVAGDEPAASTSGHQQSFPSRSVPISGPAASPLFGTFPRFRTDSHASRSSAGAVAFVPGSSSIRSGLGDSIRSYDPSSEAFEHTLPRADRPLMGGSLRDSSSSNAYMGWSGERMSGQLSAEHIASSPLRTRTTSFGVPQSVEHLHPTGSTTGHSRPSVDGHTPQPTTHTYEPQPGRF